MKIKTSAIYLIVLLFAAIIVSFSGCNETGNPSAKTLPAAEKIAVGWELIENFHQNRGVFKSRFILTNSGTVPLANRGWTFYFNFCRGIIEDSAAPSVTITHINGDFYRMTPTETFPVLKQGAAVKIPFLSSHWAINYSDAPAGGYFVFNDASGKPLKPQPVKKIEVEPFIHERQSRRSPQDNAPLSTPRQRYETNRRMLAPDVETVQRIVPGPVRIEFKKGYLVLHSGFEIRYAEGLEGEAVFLNRILEKALGASLKTVKGGTAAAGTAGTIVLEQAELQVNDRGSEAYRLRIDKANGIRITGSDDRGVFYGIRTLQALLPVDVWQEPRTEIKLETLLIEDAPRFSYRGMHLDVARNFHDKAAVKKLLNLMSFYKLNIFHFHLTDDEGWRLEIPGLPELTQLGGFRGHTEDESDRLYPSFGSGPFKDPARSPGSGYYTRAEFIEILKYAGERKVEVMPEIDVPGHARAAVKAMDARYKRLMKEGKQEQAEAFLLRDLQDQSTYKSVQHWTDNTLCVCRESVYRFLEKVVDEIRAMYAEAGVPLTAIHIGGDEVPAGVWEKSPLCREFIKENKEVSGVKQLSAYFVKRFRQILKSRGLKTAGWQEIALKHTETGEAREVPDPDLAGKGVLPYVWNNVWGWGQEDIGNRLANAGYPVVISYVTNLYFDLAYAKDPLEPGYYWGGFIDTRKAYELTPFDIRKCASTDLLGNPLDKENLFKQVELLTPAGQSNILGIQGQLWAENTKGAAMMEYLAFPKLLGLAERAWAVRPEWARTADDRQRETELNRAWTRFANALGRRELPRLDYLSKGVRYRVPLPGAVIEEGVLKANVAFPGLEIRYTLDGSQPDIKAHRYIGPVKLGKEVKTINLKTFTRQGRFSRTAVVYNRCEN
jgi:hexosaminidase